MSGAGAGASYIRTVPRLRHRYQTESRAVDPGSWAEELGIAHGWV